MNEFLELNMKFLRLLESIRFPFLDTIMSLITHIGEETVFIVIALVIFWCLDKKKGYYLLLLCFLNLMVNQALKITMHISRPWLLDPTFTIVEAARAQATGYSFPSGHTANIVAIFGCIAKTTDKKWLKVVSITTICLVAFSRMYLGVHTPFDVIVSIVLGIIFVYLFYPVYKKDDFKLTLTIWCILSAVSFVYLAYAQNKYNVALSLDLVTEEFANYESAVENAYKMIGASLGGIVAFILDNKIVKFENKATILGQIVKLALGVVVVLIFYKLPKAFLVSNLGNLGHAIRYFATIAIACGIWPMSFKYFQNIKKNN